ncbi:MAG: glycosyltransferase family 4 protein, partial [Pseudomonadota bacterium]
NSKAVAEKYSRHLTASKIHVVYQSVDGSLVSNSQVKTTPGLFRCVLAGRLHEGKGQEEAIRAIAELVRAGAPLELVLAGRGWGGYPDYLQRVTRELGVEKNVVFTGGVRDSFPYIQTASVVLVCSRSEAFGRVVVEAMWAGKPVIGARSGGLPELIEEGKIGFLYTPGDYRELAGKIKTLFDNPSQMEQMGRFGKKLAEERFSRRHYGEEIIALLNTVRQA